MTEKKPQSAVQREARLVKEPYGRRRLYHSRAAREERDGSSRYRGHERRLFAVSRVEPWSALLRFTPETIRGEALFLCPE